MKKLSQREMRLVFLTALVLVTILTLMLVRRQLAAHRARVGRMESAQSQFQLQEEALNMRPEWMVELQRIRGQLPRHPVGVDLKPALSRQVQTIAAASGLVLTELTPEAEEYVESLEVYKTQIRCGWRAAPGQLVGFLVRLQQLGPVLDVETLRLRNSAQDRNSMTGTFTLEFVYSREESRETVPLEPQETAL